jgi:hypothetical protein
MNFFDWLIIFPPFLYSKIAAVYIQLFETLVPFNMWWVSLYGFTPLQWHLPLQDNLTNCMEHSTSWEAYIDPHEISRILWNPNVRYRLYKSLPPVPNLSKICPVYCPSRFL